MTENLQKALNGQITAELWSANLYLSMSFYLEKEGFSGMALDAQAIGGRDRTRMCHRRIYGQT